MGAGIAVGAPRIGFESGVVAAVVGIVCLLVVAGAAPIDAPVE
jgi:hypothetical protein